MYLSIYKTYKNLSIAESNGRKIGLLRTLLAIFGGLFVSYLGMSALTFFIKGSAGEAIIIPLLFNTMAWAVAALWIVVSPTKLSAVLRVIIPVSCFIFIILIMF